MTEAYADQAHLVSHQSYREQAREIIRGMIVSGALAPEDLYSAPRIAADLNVSVTPVREALLDLVQEGLLRPIRNRGFQVVILTPREHDDIYKIRLLLEVPSVGQIAQNAPSAEQMAELFDLATEAERFAQDGDVISYLKVDRQFHIRLIELLDNRPLTDLVASLRDRVRLIGLANTGAKTHVVRSAAEHFDLLKRIAAGDAEGATAIMAQHLRRSRDVWGSAGVESPRKRG